MIFLLFFGLILFSSAEFQQKYSFSGSLNDNWKAFGSASTRNIHEKRYVDLTRDEQNQKGSIWTKDPSNLDNWEVTLSLYVGGGTGAEGLAFWYTKESGFLGTAFGSKERYRGFCVYFDSYDNDGSGDNPSLNIGVNNNDQEHNNDKDGSSLQVAHHRVNLRTTSSNDLGIILWKKIKVTFTSPERSGNGKNLLEVSVETQFGSGSFVSVMSASDINVPSTGYYFGVSASTGSLTDIHRIKEFYVTGTELMKNKGERTLDNSKEMTGYKALYADLTMHLPRELIEVTGHNKSPEEQMMSKTFNHILLRQYAYFLSTEGKFGSFKDIIYLFEAQNAAQVEGLKSDFQLTQFKLTTEQESAQTIGNNIQNLRKKLEELNTRMKRTVITSNDIKKAREDITVSFEDNHIETGVSYGIVFYIMVFVSFFQIIFIGLWVNSELKKRKGTALII